MVTFRKSKKIGPFRLTLTPRGVSTSIGVRGARVSLGSDGKVRRTLSVPGTGIYDTKVIGGAGRSQPRPCKPSPAVGTDRGMTLVEIQQFLNDAAGRRIDGSVMPRVEATSGGLIKRFTLR